MIGRADRWIRRTTIGCVALLALLGRQSHYHVDGADSIQLPASRIRDCEQTVTTATLAAAGCLAGLVEAGQALSARTR